MSTFIHCIVITWQDGTMQVNRVLSHVLPSSGPYTMPAYDSVTNRGWLGSHITHVTTWGVADMGKGSMGRTHIVGMRCDGPTTRRRDWFSLYYWANWRFPNQWPWPQRMPSPRLAYGNDTTPRFNVCKVDVTGLLAAYPVRSGISVPPEVVGYVHVQNGTGYLDNGISPTSPRGSPIYKFRGCEVMHSGNSLDDALDYVDANPL